MPPLQEILGVLENIADRMAVLAIIWHIIFYSMLIAFMAGWRPSARLVMTSLALPILSVGVVAWLFGNPFNSTVFMLLAILLAITGHRSDNNRISFTDGWARVAGFLMIAFGLIYPHFILNESVVSYLYRSPVGLIPCPTLSLVIGVALIIDDMRGRVWHIALISGGLIYGVIGAFRLEVKIDLVLLAGAVILAFKVIRDTKSETVDA